MEDEAIDLSVNDEAPVPAPAPAPAKEPRLIPSHDVTRIVERERAKAYEKAKRDMMANAGDTAQGFGMTQEEIRKLAQQEAMQYISQQKQQAEQEKQHAQMEKVVGSFVNKIEAASEQHPALKEKLSSIDFESFAPIVALATDLDNTADIMANLVDDPMKMSSLLTLLREQPKMAAKAVYDLSQSLRQNDAALAKNLQQANAPFDTIQRSGNMSQGGEEGLSVDDFRKRYR